MIKIGMRVSFVPSFTPFVDWSLKKCTNEYVTGRIYYINWKNKHFGVEFDCGYSKQRESFKFFQIGEEVRLLG